jgi:hypothetical protein
MGMGMLFAMSIPGLACLLILLAAGERVVQYVRRRQGEPPKLGAAGFDQITTLFYATKQLELDQRQTELMTRDEEDDGAPPRGPIDLDLGVVRLSPTTPQPSPPAG